MKKPGILLLPFILIACSQTPTLILPTDPNIAYVGRFDLDDINKPVFMYSGSAIRTVFTGTSAELIMKDDSLRNFYTVIIDDSLFVLKADRPDSTYLLARNLKNEKHTLEIIRRSEWHGGNTSFLGLRIDGGGKLFKPDIKERKIEFIGDSYTCGYGNEGLSRTEDFKYETENNYLAFGPITARAVNADCHLICRSGIGMIQGYGGGRDFNMPRLYDEVINNSGKVWDFTRYQPQLVVIDLIANDMSAPFDSVEFINAYVNFLNRIRKNYADATIVCCAGPGSPGKEYQTIQQYIHTVVDEFGKQDKRVAYFEFTPFEPNGSDWHPNVSEHQKMAEELIPFVKNLMNW